MTTPSGGCQGCTLNYVRGPSSCSAHAIFTELSSFEIWWEWCFSVCHPAWLPSDAGQVLADPGRRELPSPGTSGAPGGLAVAGHCHFIIWQHWQRQLLGAELGFWWCDSHHRWRREGGWGGASKWGGLGGAARARHAPAESCGFQKPGCTGRQWKNHKKTMKSEFLETEQSA